MIAKYQFSAEEQEEIRLNMREMTSCEKHLILLGVISCSINAAESTLSKKQKSVTRKTTRVRHLFYNHQQICCDMFMYLMEINKQKLHNLKQWYVHHGLVPRKKRSVVVGGTQH